MNLIITIWKEMSAHYVSLMIFDVLRIIMNLFQKINPSQKRLSGRFLWALVLRVNVFHTLDLSLVPYKKLTVVKQNHTLPNCIWMLNKTSTGLLLLFDKRLRGLVNIEAILTP